MKTRLDEEMGPPPPASFDVDSLLARGRRRARLRRLVTVGGGAGLSVVALGAAVAVAFTGPGPGTGGVAAPPSARASESLPDEMRSLDPTSPPDGSLPGSRLPLPSLTPQTDAEKQLSAVVKAMVQQYAPGATAAPDRSGRPPLEVRSGASAVSRSGATFEASADLTVRGGTGSFYIGIGREPEFSASTTCAELGVATTRECGEATGPHGERILRVVQKSFGGKAFIVYVTRTDGTTIALITDDGSEHNTRMKSLDEPVFTLDQLLKMGTDPRWKL
jgi:hypothetical protein